MLCERVAAHHDLQADYMFLNSAPRVEVAVCPTDVDQLDATTQSQGPGARQNIR